MMTDFLLISQRDNRAMAKGFSTSWKGAGIFKSAPSLSSPRWKDNAFSQVFPSFEIVKLSCPRCRNRVLRERYGTEKTWHLIRSALGLVSLSDQVRLNSIIEFPSLCHDPVVDVWETSKRLKNNKVRPYS